MENLIELGNYIKKIRVEKNISLRDIESKFHINKGTWAHVENASKGSIPKASFLQQIAQILEINYIELYKIVGYIDDESMRDYLK